MRTISLHPRTPPAKSCPTTSQTYCSPQQLTPRPWLPLSITTQSDFSSGYQCLIFIISVLLKICLHLKCIQCLIIRSLSLTLGEEKEKEELISLLSFVIRTATSEYYTDSLARTGLNRLSGRSFTSVFYGFQGFTSGCITQGDKPWYLLLAFTSSFYPTTSNSNIPLGHWSARIKQTYSSTSWEGFHSTQDIGAIK